MLFQHSCKDGPGYSPGLPSFFIQLIILDIFARDKTSLDITWIKQGGEEDDRTLAELMADIKEKSQTISAAVAELEKLLANIKED